MTNRISGWPLVTFYMNDLKIVIQSNDDTVKIDYVHEDLTCNFIYDRKDIPSTKTKRQKSCIKPFLLSLILNVECLEQN